MSISFIQATQSKSLWQPLSDELARWAQADQPVKLWLRDDDAVRPTAGLERLLDLCETRDVPLLIATIPLQAQTELADAWGKHPLVQFATHGIRHINNAPVDRKAEELPMERGEAIIRADLALARARMKDLFGASAAARYVPPWNRISPEVAAWLPSLGFHWISTFGFKQTCESPGLLQSNTHVDIVNWKQAKTGRSLDWTIAALAQALAQAREDGQQSVGLLTHHLVHDAMAWHTLETMLAWCADQDGVQWTAVE